MKFNRYWVRESGEIRVNGRSRPVSCYGGSNVSAEDARQDARRKLVAVQRRLDGERDAFADYVVPVREEVVRVIDDRNLVSRTRYGALILNSEDTFFIDIDQPPRSFWQMLFGRRGGKAKKDRIVAHVAALAATPRYRDLGIRLYETGKGIRAIVAGAPAAAGSEESRRILADFHADPLYAALCARQACYRARITPKPHRIRCRGHRVVYPRDAQQQADFSAWLEEYEAKSGRYAVCRFLREFGPARRSAIVDLHDELTHAYSTMPLA